MKYLALVIVLMSVLVASAKDKKQYPPVYDKTGIASARTSHYDYSATVTTNGHQAYAGCNVSGNSVDCSDSPGVEVAKLEDGNTYVLTGNAPVLVFGKYGDEEWVPEYEDNNLIMQIVKNGMKPITFNYRLVTLTGKDNLMTGSYFCIAAASVQVKRGFYAEVCYPADKNAIVAQR
jgi:hypothetical protein